MFKWPTDRIYFANSKGPAYPWLKDNIEKSPARNASVVTAAWTFSGEWDPERTVPPSVTGSSRANGIVSIAFSESVTVNGRPTLTLVGGRIADYEGGSGTSSLTFKAQTSAAPAKLNLNGGAILASIASAQLRRIPDPLPLDK